MIKGYFSIQDFTTKINRSRQWVYSLMERQKIDYVQISNRIRLIIDNKKSQKYIANANKNNTL